MDQVITGNLKLFAVTLLDDILIFSDSEKDHIEHIHRVLQRLADHNVKLNKDKCVFMKDSLEFAGMLIMPDQFKITEDKMQQIEKLKEPSNKKELQQLLGFFNYFSKFIANYASLVTPMYHLLADKVKFVWTDECHNNFTSLKSVLKENIVLNQVDNSLQIIIETDASEYAIGAILYQMKDGEKRIIEYYSKKFNDAQRSYSTVEKEALAIQLTLRKFRFLLLGKHFLIRTDHKPLLSYFKSDNTNNSRKIRQMLELEEYDYTLQYIPGKENIAADTLSRAHFISNINFGFEYGNVLKKITNKVMIMRKVGDVYFQCVHIPPELRKEKVMVFHTKFHLGIKNTYNELRKFCYWQFMMEDVKEILVSNAK